MKRKVLVVALASVWLLFSIIGVPFPKPVNANFEPAPPTEITVYSPYQGEVYNTSYLSLNFTISRYSNSGWTAIYAGRIGSLFYQIDRQTPVPITVAYPQLPEWGLVYAAGNCTLPILRNGAHNLTIWGTVDFTVLYSQQEYKPFVENITTTLTFTVNAPLPAFSNLSIGNMTYSSTQISLSFEVNGTTSWMGYSLDDQANTTISGNTTLTGLSEGSHTLTLYANDTVGNTAKSETVYFTVAQETGSQTEPEPFPTTLGTVSVLVVVAVVGVGLFVHIKKRQTQTR
jgi:hypothetical protein